MSEHTLEDEVKAKSTICNSLTDNIFTQHKMNRNLDCFDKPIDIKTLSLKYNMQIECFYENEDENKNEKNYISLFLCERNKNKKILEFRKHPNGEFKVLRHVNYYYHYRKLLIILESLINRSNRFFCKEEQNIFEETVSNLIFENK